MKKVSGTKPPPQPQTAVSPEQGQEQALVEAAVQRDLVNLLYARGTKALSASLFAALLTAALLLYRLPPLWPAVWLGAQGVVAVLRFGLIHNFGRRVQADSPLGGWRLAYTAGCLAAGFAWGALAGFFPYATLDLRLFIVMLLLGIGAGSVTTGGLNRHCAYLFLIPALGPLIGMLFTVGTIESQLLAVLALLYLFLLLVIGRQIRTDMQNNLCLVHVNAVLARRLEQSHKQIEQERSQYARMALSDPLTGLANRIALDRRLEEAAARARRSSKLFAVGILDLDDFKPINDDHGHVAGDELLKQLASRFNAILRKTDFIARSGGDEFVILFEGLHADRHPAGLIIALDRFHQAVEVPFELGQGKEVWIGMSMGLAVSDGSHKYEELLLEADKAMYWIKQHKAERENWWHISGLSESDGGQTREMPIDNFFGPTAAALLADHAAIIDRSAKTATASLVDQLRSYPQFTEIMSFLSAEDYARVVGTRFMAIAFSPHATREDLIESSREAGRVYAHIGLSGSLLSTAFILYNRLLSEHLAHSILLAGDHARVMRIISARNDLAHRTQLTTMDEIRTAYLTLFDTSLPDLPRATEAFQVELQGLANVPGIVGVLLLRADAEGRLVVAEDAGDVAQTFENLLERPEYQIQLDPARPQGGSLSARAWRELHIQVTADYRQDARTKTWHDALSRNGIRSVLAVPVRDALGRAAAVVTVYGAYPHQFHSSEARFWSQSLQSRWEMLWRRHTSRLSSPSPSIPVNMTKAARWRTRLFSGGFALYLQPVVDLVTGRVVAAEGLARLILPDGQMIAPGHFLPLLGESELYRLFRLVLDQAVSVLDDWQARGLPWSLSINLPPSCLAEPDLISALSRSLQSRTFPTERLVLEVLEWENISQSEQHDVLRTINILGLRLALDDLGAGYANLLSALRNPLDEIKIDGELIRGLTRDPLPTLALLRTLNGFFHHEMNKEFVAEGLETVALIEAMQQIGVPWGQGYAIARPMPVEAMPDWADTFRLPARPERITTFTGALAWYWGRRYNCTQQPGSYADCPMTAFLKAKGLEEGEHGQYHRRLHTGSDNPREEAQHLLDWLMAKMREEGTNGVQRSMKVS